MDALHPSRHRLNDNVGCGFMAQCEDVVRNRTMDEEIFVIEDDEPEDGPSNTAKTKQQQQQQQQQKQLQQRQNRSRHGRHGCNQYERFDEPLPESVRQDLVSQHQQATDQELQRFQQLQITNPNEGDVVYVPDDHEEEDLLIRPIQKFCHTIKFGTGLKPPTEFSYDLLKQMEDHLAKFLRNLSFPSETKIWSCVLDELTLIRFAFREHIDVCIYLLISFN